MLAAGVGLIVACSGLEFEHAIRLRRDGLAPTPGPPLEYRLRDGGTLSCVRQTIQQATYLECHEPVYDSPRERRR